MKLFTIIFIALMINSFSVLTYPVPSVPKHDAKPQQEVLNKRVRRAGPLLESVYSLIRKTYKRYKDKSHIEIKATKI